MKIAFLMGSPDISGGTNVIFEYATRIDQYGFDVYLICEEVVTPERLLWFYNWQKLRFITFQEANDILFDLVITTWWRTNYELYRVKSKSIIYFCQSIESRFYDEQDLPLQKFVNATYTLPIPIITEASWIKKYLEDNYNADVILVKNGINKSIFNDTDQLVKNNEPGIFRVLVEGPLGVPFKNTEKTIELCLKSNADEVWLLTSSVIEDHISVSRVFSKVPINETPAIYRSCDVLVKLSYVEGMFGPPLEMFHCGGTAVVYNVTGHEEYIVHNTNGIIIEKDNENEVIASINMLKENKIVLNNLKKGARDTAKNWPSWEEQAELFSSALYAHSNKSYDSKRVAHIVKFNNDWYEIHAASCKTTRDKILETTDKHYITLRKCPALLKIITTLFGKPFHFIFPKK